MKTNKVSVFYVLTSISLFLLLIFGGVYGVYVSVGLNFVKSSVSNIANVTRSNNVSYGGSVNFESSMSGVILLSIILIVLAVIDIVLLIRQVVFFKQYKFIKDSSIEHKIEKKIKSKKLLIFFVCLFNIITFAVGIAGIFVNVRAFVGNNISWVLYLVDGLVSIFSLISIVLLFKKLAQLKKIKKDYKNHNNSFDADKKIIQESKGEIEYKQSNQNFENKFHNFNIDDFEYNLLKLKMLKSSKILTAEEYQKLRLKIFEMLENKTNTSDEQLEKQSEK